VVGGKRVAVSEVPWFANLDGSCGGTLVAPDRVVTAGHCVAGLSLDQLDPIRIAGQRRKAVHFAMHPDWRSPNGENFLDDVAVIQLDAPVTTVAPVPLGPDATPPRATVLGRGASTHSGRRAGRLLEATLRTVGDRACSRQWRRARGNDGERFSAARMVCSVDVNGRRPLSSACFGDSGGPLFGGTHAAPVLYGIVSYGSDSCGGDGLPTVFAEVARYREFILAAAPVWAPVATGPSAVSGTPRVGRRLTCTVPGWDVAPDRVRFYWVRAGRRQAVVARRTTYRVRARDRGSLLGCVAQASGAGGLVTAPVDDSSVVRVRR
jgi:secreted trypsin-like serine protease